MDDITAALVQRLKQNAEGARRLAVRYEGDAARNHGNADTLDAVIAKIQSADGPVNAPALLTYLYDDGLGSLAFGERRDPYADLRKAFGLDEQVETT